MIAKKRGRPGIKPHIKALIFRKAVQNKGIPRLALAVELKNLIEEMNEVPPSEETMLRMISEAHNCPEGPLDKPFCLGALVENPIPPEALLTVMGVWAQYRKQGDTFTIREALWVSRLSSVLSEFEKVGDKNRNLGNLVQWYAIRERAYEAIGKDIDTSELDTEVLKSLKLIEREPGEDKMTPWVVEGDYLKDSTGKIRGQIRVLKEDPYQPADKRKRKKEARHERSHNQALQG